MHKRMGPLVIVMLLLLTSCQQGLDRDKVLKVGLLVPETITDQVWGTKGYQGLLKIQAELSAEVYFKEGIVNKSATVKAIEELRNEGVTLIFGHGSEYISILNQVASTYPDMHFVIFNGDATAANVTSLTFNSHAMGYFGGLVAAHMSETKKVGIVAAFEWQPEVNGFFEGALVENPDVDVKIRFVQDWNNREVALAELDELLNEGVDVVYPAGDGFNVPVIESLKSQGKYAIGYVSDQADLGEATVLTSTVQHVDRLYPIVAKRFQNGNLKSGNLYFDFQDNVITLGEFSPLVDEGFEKKVKDYIEQYKKTGILPSE